MQMITASQLSVLLDSEEEVAILDLRETGVYARGHLLFARSMPLSKLEFRVEDIVPRKDTKIVLCGNERDAEASLVSRGWEKLTSLGYRRVSVLDGDNSAWRAAGHQLFSGIYVPSKAFGEVVEHYYRTPNVTAEQLESLMAGSNPIQVFDSRPLDEFKRMSIPGAVDCPGAELVYRVPELVSSPETIVIVNCAGRTRSIIGAQSLINVGLRNPVYALRNGTMGWELAGYEVDRGKEAMAPPPSPDGLARAQSLAEEFARRASVIEIDWPEYQRFSGDLQRTCYLFDVRTAEEFLAGHISGAVHAPGGQLVQATDNYVGTLRSRLVLFDDKSVRALMTAAWLKLAGWRDVFVLRSAPPEWFRSGNRPRRIPAVAKGAEISAAELAALLDRGEAHLIDLASSSEFLAGHIVGARFAIRARLAGGIGKLEHKPYMVLTSPDGVLASFALPEASLLWRANLRVLAGGTAAWRASGRKLESGFDCDRALDPPEDLWHAPSSFFGGGKPAMQEYIDWETGLIERIRHEPGLRFEISF